MNDTPSQTPTCWHCQTMLAPSALKCPACGAVAAHTPADYFAAFGLPRVFNLDDAVLEEAYLSAQTRMHPDRFSHRGPRNKALAAGKSAWLNEAYETLKTPAKRAVYLLEISGSNLSNVKPTPELLARQFALQEQLEDASSLKNLNALRKDVQKRRALCIKNLSHAFETEAFADAAHATLELQFLDKILKELEKKEGISQ